MLGPMLFPITAITSTIYEVSLVKFTNTKDVNVVSAALTPSLLDYQTIKQSI